MNYPQLIHMTVSTLLATIFSYTLLTLFLPELHMSFGFVFIFSALGTAISQLLRSGKKEDK